MKKSLSYVSILMMIVTVSCNMGSNKNETPVTISADTTIKPVDHTGTNSTAMADTTSIKKMEPAIAKPNPAKKGKKGKVSITMMSNRNQSNTDMMDNEGYYTNVYPAYPGGQKALEDFFEKNIEYPQDATDNGVEGVVNISFAVDEKGKISAIKAVNPTLGYGLEDEALRVFKKMPSWTPGSLKGKNVKTKYSLPLRFELSE